MDTLCSRTGRSQRYPSKEDRAGRSGKVCGRNPDMHAVEKSDIGIVPKKAPNKVGKPMAEVLEGRTMTKGNF